MSFWGEHERQGITYVTVPEYQPSSASLTIGDPFYGASGKTQNITVKSSFLDTGTIVLIAIPVGLLLVWLWRRK